MPQSTISLSPRRRSRFFQLLIALALILAVLHIMQGSKVMEKQLLESQTQTVTRSLVEQTANAASLLLQDQDEESLNLMATTLTHHPAIQDVAIYDINGYLVSTSDDYMPLKDRLKQLIHDDPAVRLTPRVSYVYSQGEAIGYLQFSVLYLEMMADSTQIRRVIDERSRLSLLMAAIAGFLLSGSVRRGIRAASRTRRHQLASPNDGSTTKADDTPS
ncbi:AhpA/YtjB family protein [Echinimonas agarilytica]|uniref:AhpA/YtjB family protein n=1 Tax=Echinimonas agarilytica TaxID=1215918 RepID=A0AA41W8Y9_9GAMM|nr:AhpA/YtjB family protein [Echinimonas agarilytica]